MYGVHSVTLYMFLHMIVTAIGSLQSKFFEIGKQRQKSLCTERMNVDDDVFTVIIGPKRSLNYFMKKSIGRVSCAVQGVSTRIAWHPVF